MKADRRAQGARPRGMSLASLLREAKGGACPPLLRSYALLYKIDVYSVRFSSITRFNPLHHSCEDW